MWQEPWTSCDVPPPAEWPLHAIFVVMAVSILMSSTVSKWRLRPLGWWVCNISLRLLDLDGLRCHSLCPPDGLQLCCAMPIIYIMQLLKYWLCLWLGWSPWLWSVYCSEDSELRFWTGITAIKEHSGNVLAGYLHIWQQQLQSHFAEDLQQYIGQKRVLLQWLFWSHFPNLRLYTSSWPLLYCPDCYALQAVLHMGHMCRVVTSLWPAASWHALSPSQCKDIWRWYSQKSLSPFSSLLLCLSMLILVSSIHCLTW